MNIFGYMNGCYWKMLSTIEEIKQELSSMAFESVLRGGYAQRILDEGGYIWVNQSGGFHGGKIEEKTEILASEDFPSLQDRVEYLKNRLDLEIQFACEETGMSRENILNEL